MLPRFVLNHSFALQHHKGHRAELAFCPVAFACMEDREVDILAECQEKGDYDHSGGGFLPDRKIRILDNCEVRMNEP